MSTTLLLADDVTLDLIFQTVSLVLFYVALAWLPLRAITALLRYAARRKKRADLMAAVEAQPEDRYCIGMKILPPM